MAEEVCLHCNAAGAEQYDLLIRGNDHEGVFLCSDCYEAIQAELADNN